MVAYHVTCDHGITNRDQNSSKTLFRNLLKMAKIKLLFSVRVLNMKLLGIPQVRVGKAIIKESCSVR